MIQNFPVLISASCVTLYWSIVVIKLIRLSRKIGKTPNIIPEEKLGKKLRFIWAPIIMLWIIQSILGIGHPLLPTAAEQSLQYCGAFFALIATLLTLICWHKMGTSWRIGIDPNEKTQLIISGPYQFVRHPIYTLSIILAIATFLTLPTLFMFVTIAIHISLLLFEAIREEKYLVIQHGEQYANYIKITGRFLPKML